MPSIIPNYEYDIFISYRQKDNKGEHWVTEFVNALKTELEATFKDDISIYFDENPHDGLLETHNVDKSLEGKLKCLVFIPIISQTYCDPKSFAWQHEFCAFNKLAKEDQFGRDIKLNNGNVASRILPVKVHDLDAEDKSILEIEIGSSLRSIEFIYKSAGVNRPLNSNDERDENLNHTKYRDQINKVANAAKGLISSLRNPQWSMDSSKKEIVSLGNQSRSKSTKWFIAATVLLFSMIGGWWYYHNHISIPGISQFTRESRIAVLPFENKTNDSELDILGDMAADWITQGLMNLDDVKVVSFQTIKDNIKYASLKPTGSEDNEFGKRTGAETIIQGRFYKQGEELTVQIQVMDAHTGEVKMIVPEIKGKRSDLQNLVNELRERTMTGFILTSGDQLLKNYPPKIEAYKSFSEAFVYYGIDDQKTSGLFKRAIAQDSGFILPYIFIAEICLNSGENAKADSVIKQIENRFPGLPFHEEHMLGDLVNRLNGNLERKYRNAKEAFSKDPKNLYFNDAMGASAFAINRPAEAVKCFSKIELSSLDFNIPVHTWWIRQFAMAQIRINHIDEARELLRHVPLENTNFNSTLLGVLAYTYILKNEEDSLQVLFNKMKGLNLSPGRMAATCRIIAQKYALRKDISNQLKWAGLGLGYEKQVSQSQPMDESEGLAYSLYYAGQLHEALSVFIILNERKPKWQLLSAIGCIYAKLGKPSEAFAKINDIEALDYPYERGETTYGLAQILAALGEKEKSMESLKQAFKEGVGFIYYYNNYDQDFELVPLLDYPPFQEFVKPKG